MLRENHTGYRDLDPCFMGFLQCLTDGSRKRLNSRKSDEENEPVK